MVFIVINGIGIWFFLKNLKFEISIQGTIQYK